jgi:hypothetical protein
VIIVVGPNSRPFRSSATRKRGALYAIWYRYRGVIRHEPFRARTLRAAQAARTQRLEEIRAGRGPSPADTHPLGSLLDAYLAGAHHDLDSAPSRKDRQLAQGQIKRIVKARRALLAAFGAAARVKDIRHRLALEPSRVPGAPVLRAAVRWAEWRASSARAIGSLLFERYRLALVRAILPQAQTVWQDGYSTRWAPTSRRRVPSVNVFDQADARVARRIARLLAWAIALEVFDKKFAPRSSAGQHRVAAHRARAGPAAGSHEALRRGFEQFVARERYEADTAFHSSAYHVERPWSGVGRPPTPGLEYFVAGMRALAADLKDPEYAAGLRMRLLWAEVGAATICRVMQAKPLRRPDETPRALAQRLRKIAVRLSHTEPSKDTDHHPDCETHSWFGDPPKP